MTKSCPACGSDSINTSEIHNRIHIAYGDNDEYIEVVDHCLSCGEEGDFSDVNNTEINRVLNQAKRHSVCNIIDFLQDQNVKTAYLERALELPARTVNRWKTKEPSASGLALLRIIRTYPWILEVADADYDETVSRSKLLEQAAKDFYQICEANNFDQKYRVAPGRFEATIATKPEFIKTTFTANNDNNITANHCNY
ncbi:MAG: hypothetical protein PHR16_05725 [Methylovulum sp.]|nr:hypothetical protein [Methylovulum sp.]